MDIQKKQARWLTEKPLFEAEFIFTALLNNVEFNIKTGDFDVTQDCPESDRELTHEVVNHSWVMWLRAKASAVPEGFVLVPKECSDEMAEIIAITAKVCGGIAGDVYDAVVKQAVIEAREPTND
ncbi:hypothetical protein [Acinetobacter pullicarnis]|uniref:hypothetical protein n=1 Tax=Acinetobacter pullicarnis TaxID=2576829 RepID=UPI001121F437|nr:hypothetical protein [Acinetobacter pullicarnis]